MLIFKSHSRSFLVITALIIYAFPLFSDSITISTNPGTLSITTATAGSNPLPVSDSLTTYSVTTTNVVRNITGKINTNMPTGLTLSVQLVAPLGASSAGSQAMSSTAANLVTSIPKNTVGALLGITYTLTATAAAAPTASSTRTLTLTLQ